MVEGRLEPPSVSLKGYLSSPIVRTNYYKNTIFIKIKHLLRLLLYSNQTVLV